MQHVFALVSEEIAHRQQTRLARVDFVTEGRSPILAGKSGRGKRHLAIAIAYRAIQNGFDAFFTTAAALIDDLSAAFRAGELAHALWLRHNRQIVGDPIPAPWSGTVRCSTQSGQIARRPPAPGCASCAYRWSGT
jgi:hypothetical protein